MTYTSDKSILSETKLNELSDQIQIAGFKYIDFVKERWCEEVADLPMDAIDYDFTEDALKWASQFYNDFEEIKAELEAAA